MSAQVDSAGSVPVPPGLKLKFQPIELPVSHGLQQHGFSGPTVGEATDEQLSACLVVDRRYLFGGSYTDDRGDAHTKPGVLADRSLNPRAHEDADSFLADVLNGDQNRKAVYRVWSRIRAVEAEQQRRAVERGRESQEARDLARKRLTDFLEHVPGVAAQYRQLGREAAAAMALVRPLVAALEILQGCYPREHYDLRSTYADLIAKTEKAAHALGRAPPELSPLSQLPDGAPTFAEVSRLCAVLQGKANKSQLPDIGTGSRFEQTLRDAGGG